ncbi:MAG TPA: S9 family peptidase [Bryobacteraceae bacterium]|nr:S9 family peptidase [Bryobacteraceae bacterium]
MVHVRVCPHAIDSNRVARGGVSVMVPPSAPKIPKPRTVHGETVIDEWFYLRDREHPATIPYIEAENAYTDAVLQPAGDLRQQLYNEMVGRIQEDDSTVPWQLGDYEYYSRTERGCQYSIHCRRALNTEREEILLDCNQLAAGHDYFSLAFHQVSPDGKRLAYATDTDGSEVYTLRFRDLETGESIPGEIRGVYYSADWAADSATFFFTTLDDTKRPYRLWRVRIGLGSAPVLVYEESDARFNVSIRRTRSGRYLLLTVDSHASSEVRYLNAGAPDGEFRLINARRDEIEYFVEHHGPWFYIRTNENGRNFRLLRAPVSDPSPANRAEIIAHRTEVAIEHVEAFESHLVLLERADALPRLRILNPGAGTDHTVAFDQPVYTIHAEHNAEYRTTRFRFVYSSPIEPRSVFDYDMETRERELKKRDAVLGGFSSDDYATERIYATACDGVRIPISLAYRKEARLDGPNPAYLYGYGAYGIVTEPSFAPERISLLDRGVIFAIAHIRGSGDLGRIWYDEGRRMKKKNTFTDFIACAEHLIAQGYTSPDRLAIAGGSAGGLLIGAVLNARPELFRAAVAQVPFVDVVNTMLDVVLPLTVTEYDEWGNPNEWPPYEYIRSYAPYEHVERKAYPDILATGGLNDPRVPYWEPAKWISKLRDRNTAASVILLKTNMGAGHGGPSGRYQKIAEKALEYAFILPRLAPDDDAAHPAG